jgi:hypothetical protein
LQSLCAPTAGAAVEDILGVRGQERGEPGEVGIERVDVGHDVSNNEKAHGSCEGNGLSELSWMCVSAMVVDDIGWDSGKSGDFLRIIFQGDAGKVLPESLEVLLARESDAKTDR